MGSESPESITKSKAVPGRVGSRPALLAAHYRGKGWKPSQGFHINGFALFVIDSPSVPP
jgi:hypothetical protein